MPGFDAHRPLLAYAVLGLLAFVLTAWCWTTQLPALQWWGALLHPRLDDPQQLVFHFSALPRALTALLAGAGLGLAGLLLQQTLRNPLASPTTLGLEAGSQLALTVVLVAAPGLLVLGRPVIALAGTLLALGFVMACAARNRFSSVALVLAGLVAGLFCGALTIALRLLNQEYVATLFLWGGGSLAQQDWSAPAALAPSIGALYLLTALLARPFELLALDEENARALGVPLGLVRSAGLLLAALLTAVITAHVGVIGFVGLAAPQIARLAGARRFAARLVLAPLTGALLVLAVDAIVGLLEAGGIIDLPTGAATALLGAPLLLWLLPRLRRSEPPSAQRSLVTSARDRTGLLPLLAVLLVLAAVGALLIGHGSSGWQLIPPAEFALVEPWRAPRAAIAALAGAMLATAGLLLQRVSGNPLAAPEVLGIGTGVAFGMALAMILGQTSGLAAHTAAGAAGGFLALFLVLMVGRRSGFAPDQVLLTGLALSALLDVVIVAFLALGDPRAPQVLAWMAGSTYYADWSKVLTTAVFAGLLLPSALALRRWLDIVPMGSVTARALGLPVQASRLAILAMASLLTSVAVMATGPLTFVGLAGPHMARLIGLRRAWSQILGSVLIGALVMVVADVLARTLIAPRELPTGVVAALIGLPYLIWQLGRRPH
ncbi:Fe(3+)-hydroxamate ABC transporter permease FhuB [Labrys sp. ZIDIC5]|uniref:Fe(3+)-hydroxamate ABC transporter permease FhuB n=1 Tax=Labrys sedimenti TaxID=3106036 RepID=UPI002ACAFAB2|nr:Fe(3+)-hydroxamate ABC transporter permease FhuB [Labrys sp. ZIDIC5]MDZ5452244.1 Fe(3+)-hydroxamate ABC transporter permease FhuB [Labrys sp. ZIDIC5]